MILLQPWSVLDFPFPSLLTLPLNKYFVMNMKNGIDLFCFHLWSQKVQLSFLQAKQNLISLTFNILQYEIGVYLFGGGGLLCICFIVVFEGILRMNLWTIVIENKHSCPYPFLIFNFVWSIKRCEFVYCVCELIPNVNFWLQNNISLV